jgi:hypothetical protein
MFLSPFWISEPCSHLSVNPVLKFSNSTY